MSITDCKAAVFSFDRQSFDWVDGPVVLFILFIHLLMVKGGDTTPLQDAAVATIETFFCYRLSGWAVGSAFPEMCRVSVVCGEFHQLQCHLLIQYKQ